MKFRKRPVVIEAMQVPDPSDGKAWADLAYWIDQGQMPGTITAEPSEGMNGVDGLLIHTLEGTMRADIGDWIIKGVKGEFYPCKPDIFDATYEAVTD